MAPKLEMPPLETEQSNKNENEKDAASNSADTQNLSPESKSAISQPLSASPPPPPPSATDSNTKSKSKSNIEIVDLSEIPDDDNEEESEICKKFAKATMKRDINKKETLLFAQLKGLFDLFPCAISHFRHRNSEFGQPQQKNIFNNVRNFMTLGNESAQVAILRETNDHFKRKETHVRISNFVFVVSSMV